MRSRKALLPAVFLAAITSAPVMAAGTGGCDSFAFPLTTELGWMQAADAAPAASGAKLDAPPASAIAVTLSPAAEVKLVVPPTGKPKNKPEESFAAILDIANVPSAGLYQVSLSGPGWIDVIQDGAALKAGEHTGKSDCEGLRKSVRFDLKAGPATLQLSDVPANALRITIRKAD